jgi:ubiquitin C-terminal hydrolase/Ca2+-binding EF-hand superfamily protein
MPKHIPFHLLELLNTLTPAHINQLRQRYESHSVGRGLFKSTLSQVLPQLQVLPERIQDAVFRALDLNQDGNVGFTELCVACAVGKLNDTPQQLAYLFSILDLKKDKVVDAWELGTVLSTPFLVLNSLHPRAMDNVKGAQASIPQQGLTFAQFKPWARKHINLHETSQFLRILSTPEEECIQFVRLLEAHLDLVEGEIRYIVSAQWMLCWSQYCSFDLKQLLPNCTRDTEKGEGSSPFPLDNTDIQDPQDSRQLRETVRMGIDCYPVAEEVWRFLIELYGGGPAFPRKVTVVDEDLVIDIFPATVSMFRLQGDWYDKRSKTVLLLPLHWSLGRLRKEVQEKAPFELFLHNRGSWVKVTDSLTLEECRATSGALRFLTVPFASDLSSCASLEIIKSARSLRRVKTKGSQDPMAEIGLGVLLTEEETLLETRGLARLSSGIEAQGVPNISNTCYLNAVLQVLARSPFGDYIRVQGFSAYLDQKSGDYLVWELSLLFMDMTSKGRSDRVPDPENLLVLLAAKAPDFKIDGQQRDSYECLITLLDLAHAELKVGAPTPLLRELTSPSKQEETEVSRTLYNAMRGAGSSLVSDLFFNILKSEIYCKSCGFRKVTINSALSLYLQAPITHIIQVKVAVVTLSGTIINVGLELDLQSTVSQAIETIAGLVELPKSVLRLVTFKEKRVFMIHIQGTKMQDLVESESGLLYAVECRQQQDRDQPPPPEAPSESRPVEARVIVKVLHRFGYAGKRILALPGAISIPRSIKYEEMAEELKAYAKVFQANEASAYTLHLLDFRSYRCCLCAQPDCKGCPLPTTTDALDWASMRQMAPAFVISWAENSFKVSCSSHESYNNIQEKLRSGFDLSDCLRLSADAKLSEAVCSQCKIPYHTQEGIIYTGDIFLICLERFTRHQTQLYKNKHLIKFPVKGLDLSQWLSSPAAGLSVYDLFGVINHEGSASGGHNTCFCRTDKGTWVYCDDSKVLEVMGEAEEKVVTADAYILCYRRRELTGRSQVQLML